MPLVFRRRVDPGATGRGGSPIDRRQGGGENADIGLDSGEDDRVGIEIIEGPLKFGRLESRVDIFVYDAGRRDEPAQGRQKIEQIVTERIQP